MWLAEAGEDAEQHVVLVPEVTTASTNAIDITAPVFCTSTRAPAAMPRRCGRDGAHHRGGVGRVEHARADADDEHVRGRATT